MAGIFAQVSRPKLKELAGRGIHLAVLSAWMLYVFSNVVRTDTRHAIDRMPDAGQSDSDDDDF